MSAAPRIAASPYARRLARERGIPLTALRGSGPSGRIVAGDIVRRPAAVPDAPPAISAPFAAFATRVRLIEINAVLERFAAADMPFELDDLVLRAAACALEDADASAGVPGTPIALERVDDGRRWQAVLDNVRLGSLAPLRARRLTVVKGSVDQSGAPATLSLRVLPAGRVRPALMPLLPRRVMRLVLVPDLSQATAECLLTFDPAILRSPR